jgi:hypothetical protein
MECGTGNPDSLASRAPFDTTSACLFGSQMTKIFQAKWSFVTLQLLDLATTLFAFHLGGYEMNPLVARMATILGPIGGVAVSKALAVLIAWRVQKLLWVANLFYTGIVSWNIVLIAVTMMALKH